MKYVSISVNGTVLCKKADLANHFFSRFMGLMWRKRLEPDCGLLLVPCNEIHTFGMRFDIDTVALSQDDEVLFIDKSVPPHKVRSKVDGAKKVLELESGAADRHSLKVGDKLIIDVI